MIVSIQNSDSKFVASWTLVFFQDRIEGMARICSAPLSCNANIDDNAMERTQVNSAIIRL